MRVVKSVADHNRVYQIANVRVTVNCFYPIGVRGAIRVDDSGAAGLVIVC